MSKELSFETEVKKSLEYLQFLQVHNKQDASPFFFKNVSPKLSSHLQHSGHPNALKTNDSISISTNLEPVIRSLLSGVEVTCIFFSHAVDTFDKLVDSLFTFKDSLSTIDESLFTPAFTLINLFSDSATFLPQNPFLFLCLFVENFTLSLAMFCLQKFYLECFTTKISGAKRHSICLYYPEFH